MSAGERAPSPSHRFAAGPSLSRKRARGRFSWQINLHIPRLVAEFRCILSVQTLLEKHINLFSEVAILSINGIMISARHIDLIMEGIKLPGESITSHTKHINLPLSRRAGEGGTRREAVGG